MTRLFVALLIPDEIKTQIIKFRDEAFSESHNYKWEHFDKIHLTLKFIGEVDDKLIIPIADSINYVSGYKSLNCQLTRFGFFYGRDEAKILWMGLKIENPVYELVESINNKLEEFSIPAEKKKFKPHLTLKRFKLGEGKKFIGSFEGFEVPAVKFVASKIALFKSELLPSGAKYTEIKNYNLK